MSCRLSAARSAETISGSSSTSRIRIEDLLQSYLSMAGYRVKIA
ncbi:hypothetical protein MPL3356_220154 [Mesorhizobium plurifarium]|uniref:Uncharacterized protein n=1 Tax=Mesorhizobium plurifarium TaxID=69974 RepID=A0A090DQG8_MESPL|nr:hypothetical protein MPL3356_220154 [Mesorhizobium plurifarium]